MRKQRVQEVYVWGKAELEDMLFQPKNDHLLFAYFGVSLAIRRRSLRTEIRSKLSMKKTVFIGALRGRAQGYFNSVRKWSSYPYKDEGFKKNPGFYESYFLGHYYDGIICRVKEFFAYLHPDRKRWDYFPNFNETA